MDKILAIYPYASQLLWAYKSALSIIANKRRHPIKTGLDEAK